MVDLAEVDLARPPVVDHRQQVLGRVDHVVGNPQRPATTLVEPPGSTETGTSVPASPFATSFSVPSPPKATTTS